MRIKIGRSDLGTVASWRRRSVPSGKYRDHLIVGQHRYFLGTGSYDWYWLFDLNGREIRPIGENADQLKQFNEIYVQSAD